VQQHQAHPAELQWQQEEQRQIDLDQEVLQHQAHVAQMQKQEQQQRQMADDEDVVQHQVHLDQQWQLKQEEDAEHVQQVINDNQALENIPKVCCPYQKPPHRHFLGPMNVRYPSCHAVYFKSERLTHSSNTNPRFGICCLQGQIQLPSISGPPQLLHCLLTSSTPCTRKFRESICQYSAAFAFTSAAVKMDDSILNGHGTYSIRIHGALHQKMGALCP